MICRDGALEQRLYALSDANYNVTAVIEPDGDVVERYVYDAYGNVTVLNPDFTVKTAGTAYAWTCLEPVGNGNSRSFGLESDW
jgi:YD repeat-containing protein